MFNTTLFNATKFNDTIGTQIILSSTNISFEISTIDITGTGMVPVFAIISLDSLIDALSGQAQIPIPVFSLIFNALADAAGSAMQESAAILTIDGTTLTNIGYAIADISAQTVNVASWADVLAGFIQQAEANILLSASPLDYSGNAWQDITESWIAITALLLSELGVNISAQEAYILASALSNLTSSSLLQVDDGIIIFIGRTGDFRARVRRYVFPSPISNRVTLPSHVN